MKNTEAVIMDVKPYFRVRKALFMLSFVISVCVASANVHSAKISANPDTVSTFLPLQIGDTIPEYLWNLPLQVANHPGGKNVITLNDYRDKLIILDFWATWCVPCITSIAKMDTLQRTFEHEELVILPVTYEPASKAAPVFVKNGWHLPTIVGDTLLKRLFPHKTVPHHVWIQRGEAIAMTYPEYATPENFRLAIENQPLRFLMKDGHLTNAEVPIVQVPLYQSSISKRTAGNHAGFTKRDNELVASNLDIESLFRCAYFEQIPYSGWINRVFVEVDSAKRPFFERPVPSVSGTYDLDSLWFEWRNENTYCYRLTTHFPYGKSRLAEIMQADLNQFFSLYLNVVGKIERRVIPCLALHAISKNDQLVNLNNAGKGHKDDAVLFQHQSMGDFIERLASINRKLSTPLVDETGYTGAVAIELQGDLRDIAHLNSELARYGLKLIEEDHEIEVLVIADCNKNRTD